MTFLEVMLSILVIEMMIVLVLLIVAIFAWLHLLWTDDDIEDGTPREDNAV